jgi:putative transposase
MPHDIGMARLGRIVAAGFPHHVTQRGNRRQTVFFEPADYALYRDLLAERCRKASVEVWAYCLMPNHVHLVLTPSTPDGLARAIGETHRQYTGFINARARWTGHLFQGRFSSVALDDAHLVAAARYVALNPVRARLVACAEDWAWSSARAHLAGRDDALVRVAPLLETVSAASAISSTATATASRSRPCAPQRAPAARSARVSLSLRWSAPPAGACDRKNRGASRARQRINCNCECGE